MTISYNWLRDYLDCALDVTQIELILTDIGLEVEKIAKKEAIRGGLEGVVTGHVLTCERHPDADRLSITTVDVGDGDPLQIVCGAPNVAPGQKVAVATIGTTLYPQGEEDGFKIKKSKIRGVESFGMICAEDELGIGESHEGIMVLDDSTPVGQPFIDFIDRPNDYIIEIGLTPNRIDAASHYGVARDLVAYMQAHDIPFTLSLPETGDIVKAADDREIGVEVDDAIGAPRYSGVTMTGIKVAPSPEWMQERLRAIGINPKNNVVDITNYILHETGQPLHAFDADRIEGGKIVVRRADEGTPFTTLDGVERTLSSEDLMICDSQKPLCIAGVMGGMDSGVSEQTTSVFIESAWFNAQSVRKTARRHGINSDSSFRFERGTDPDMVPYALRRAVTLLKEYASGEVSSDITDIYPVPAEPHRFGISTAYLNRLVGQEIPAEDIRKILAGLQVTIENEAEGLFSVAVPPYRVDVARPADLVEDILRIYGYNRIEIPKHIHASVSYAPKPDKDKLAEMLADMLASTGLTQAMSNSLTKSSYYNGLDVFPEENCVRILNPLSADLNVMRQTLLFGILEAMQLNTNRKNPDLKFFELGNTYRYGKTEAEQDALTSYSEKYTLAIGITGLEKEVSWNSKPDRTGFFHLRGIVEKVMARFGVDIYDLREETVTDDIFPEALSLGINGKPLLRMGAVSPKIRKDFDLKAEVYFMEMDFDLLVKATAKHTVKVTELSRFPEVKRDLALVVDKSVRFSELRKAAFAEEKKLLKGVSLFDVYEGDKVAQGKKSYALSFILEDKTKTLTDNEIDRVMNNLLRRFQKECGAELRA